MIRSDDACALDALMPMHLWLDCDGRITHAAPTILKLCPQKGMVGKSLFEVFNLRRPRAISTIEDLALVSGSFLRLNLRKHPDVAFKGVLAVLPEDRGYILNLSFGIAVIDAVGTHDLSAADFAPTDLTIEMLYLHEAKSAVLAESRRLNSRLEGAKIAAEEQAYTDTLTGLKNRRALDHVLDRMIQAGESFGLLHVDLDYFKDVNDRLGHAAGDYVLQHVARVFLEETRGEDTIARVGGDEFVLVLRNLISLTRLRTIGKRIIATLEEPVMHQGQECNIAASIGTTVTSYYKAPDAAEMVHHADIALYASKNAGRACFTAYEPGMQDLTPAPLEDAQNAGETPRDADRMAG